jgi:hypothetical protein
MNSSILGGSRTTERSSESLVAWQMAAAFRSFAAKKSTFSVPAAILCRLWRW